MQLAKQDWGQKRPLRKTRCRKFSVKLVLTGLLASELNVQDYLMVYITKYWPNSFHKVRLRWEHSI